MPLSYTPRKFVSHPNHKLFYLVEADHHTLGPDVTENLLGEMVSREHDIMSFTF
jgi:splicing factor 3B subunit 3